MITIAPEGIASSTTLTASTGTTTRSSGKARPIPRSSTVRSSSGGHRVMRRWSFCQSFSPSAFFVRSESESLGFASITRSIRSRIAMISTSSRGPFSGPSMRRRGSTHFGYRPSVPPGGHAHNTDQPAAMSVCTVASYTGNSAVNWLRGKRIANRRWHPPSNRRVCIQTACARWLPRRVRPGIAPFLATMRSAKLSTMYVAVGGSREFSRARNAWTSTGSS